MTMSDSDGPKVDIPEELAAELEAKQSGETGAGDEAGGSGEDTSAAYAELNDKYLRLAAEFENFRRRTLKERQDLLNYGNENLIKELLPSVDNLERALGQASKEEEGIDAENLLEGVELTHRTLLQVLEKSGVTTVSPDANKDQFNPSLHEALRQVPSEEHEAGTILEVYQIGFQLKDRLLRPALVAVAGPSGSSESE